VTCPYSKANCQAPSQTTARLCQCGRLLKFCSQCAAANRAFANFCRGCGAALPIATANWTSYRGSSRRLGLNPAAPASDYALAPPALKLELGDACASILGYDGHLVAVSLKGVVEVVEIATNVTLARFSVPGSVTAEPCIRDGILYITGGRQLAAYSLPAMTLDPPVVRPLWTLPLEGIPVHAVTIVGDRLYVTLATREWRDVHVIEGIARPTSSRSIFGSPKVSWLAADPEQEQAVFLSESDGAGVQLHLASRDVMTHRVNLRQLAEHPVALIDGSLFGIFGETNRLHRTNAVTGAVEEMLSEDTQFFALSTNAGNEWDRQAVYIDSGGIYFSRSGVRDSFEPYDRAVKGSPVIVRDCAALVGMEDGRVRVYNFAQLPRHESWLLNDGSPITTLASFDSYVAAGNRRGLVEVRELRTRGAA
jgi:hypothetical protein